MSIVVPLVDDVAVVAEVLSPKGEDGALPKRIFDILFGECSSLPGMKVLCAAALLLSVLCLKPVLRAEERSQVAIGVIAPLTQVNADRGEEMVRTLTLLQERFAERPLKHAFRFLIDDGKCGVGNSATTITQKFLNEDHLSFFITGCSGETIQAANLAERAHAVSIGALASDPAVRELGPYTFRTYVDIEQGIKEISRCMIDRPHQKIAVFSEDVPFNQKIDGLLRRELGDRVVLQNFFPANSSDFGTLLAKIRALKADALYANCAGPATAANLVNQARRMSLTVPIFTYFMPGEKSFREAVGANAEGIVYVDVPDVESVSKDYRDFVARYEERYPQGAQVEFLRRSTYDAAMLLVTAIEAVGPNASAVKDYLGKMEFDGALGRVRFDAAGDVVGLRFILRKIEKGSPQVFHCGQ